MLNKINKMLRQEQGFTLMELMIVVVIIGILAAIAVPTYQGIQDRAKTAVGQANAQMLNRAKDQMVAFDVMIEGKYQGGFDGSTQDAIDDLLEYLDLEKVEHVKWDTDGFVAEVGNTLTKTTSVEEEAQG